METAVDSRIIKPYVDIARRAGICTPKEIELIEELIRDCKSCVGPDYIIIDEMRDDRLIGYAVLGRIEWTKFSWELYWIMVDKDFKRQGIGKKLLHEVERFLARESKHAVLVAEISSTAEYEPARIFCMAMGFAEVGTIPDFFSRNDSKITYYKEIRV